MVVVEYKFYIGGGGYIGSLGDIATILLLEYTMTKKVLS